MMNPEAREIFDRITMMPPTELLLKENSYDRNFLKARRAYLRPEQLEVFKEVLGNVNPMSPEAKATFNKENQRAENKARKEAEAKAEETKTVQESQNPGGK